jgi:hypothetical protein
MNGGLKKICKETVVAYSSMLEFAWGKLEQYQKTRWSG